MTIRIAHRGFIYFKELNNCKDNSYNSIRNAIINNFDMIEVDIQLTKDNIIVLYHDLFIKNLLISELNYNELHNIDSDILTLNELFLIKGNTKMIYLDLKGADKLANKLIDYFNNNLHIFNDYKNNIYICSFNKVHLEIINHHLNYTNCIYNKKIKLGLITDNKILENDIEILINQFNKLSVICFNWNILNNKIIEKLQERSIEIYCFTCTNKYVLNEINKYKIDGIVSDILL